MGGRGNNFTPEEILALAKAWVVVSKRLDEQNADTFWSNVASKYAEIPEPDPRTQRSANSLRCQWTTVQRNTQKYLAADSLYRSNIPSGETEEDTKENIMELYRQKNKVKGRNGELKPAPPIKYLPAVWLLSQEPKFSQKYSGSSEEKNGYRGISGSSTSGYKSHSGEISPEITKQSSTDTEGDPQQEVGKRRMEVMEAPLSELQNDERPIGVKKRKLGERKEDKISKAIESFASVVEKAASQRAKHVALTLKTKIVQMMEDGPEKQAALLGLMQSADELEADTSR